MSDASSIEPLLSPVEPITELYVPSSFASGPHNSQLITTGCSTSDDSLYKASVIVGGTKCPIYGIKKEDGRIIGYIEAKTGEHYQVQALWKSDMGANGVRLNVDGEFVDCRCYYKQKASPTPAKTFSSRPTGTNGKQNLMFEKLQVVPTGKAVAIQPTKLGTIEVEILQFTAVKKSTCISDRGLPKETGSHRQFNVSVLEDYSHETVFGELMPKRATSKAIYERRISLEKFEIRYLSKELLQLKRIIEITDSNAQLALENEVARQRVLRREQSLLRRRLTQLSLEVQSGSEGSSTGSWSPISVFATIV
ncbi:hypothetical protein P7C70_g3514, partial [Phenoliferia sp. Uapishka_3]